MVSNSVRELFFVLLRAGLRGEVPVLPEVIAEQTWRQLYHLAAAQGVAAIVWDGIETAVAAKPLSAQQQLPRQLKLQWAMNVHSIEQLYEKQETAIGRLAGIYGRHKIEMMLLKGYGLSLCYPHPSHRPCGDIDIWLFGRQAEADNVLHEECGTDICVDKHHHTTFSFDGILVENHYDFVNIHAHRSNRELEQELQHLATQEGETVFVGENPVKLPPADFNALFLLRHAAAHFAAAEIGMRHVTDWALFVEKQGEAVDWKALYDFARKMNMHRFLNCLNALIVDFLGTTPEKMPAFERDTELEKRVLDEILQPEFSEKLPEANALRIVWFKYRRWWANRWKHRMVYREGLLPSFVQSVWCHLLKPHSIAG